VLFCLPAVAQYPGQYPPYGYPGGGMGIPFPGIHLPGRKPKTENGSKITVESAAGTLRSLAEKELVLQLTSGSSSGKIVRFRLIPTTEFLGKDGKPVRDSLLHPGDRVTIDVNPGDLETALHVILDKSGSDSDKEKAGRPVDETRIMTPESGDFGKEHSVNEANNTDAMRDAGSSDSSGGPGGSGGGRPSLSRQPDERPAPVSQNEAAPAASQNEATRDVAPRDVASHDESVDAIIADARAAASSFSADLPNFLVQQVTTRYAGSRNSDKWRSMDVVTADVSSVGGKEEYHNIRVNGNPTDRPEDTGTWSTGEFQVTLQDILSVRTNATFTRRGDDRIRNRNAWVFDLSVDQPHSHWTIEDDRGRSIKPAYRGTIWVDKETRRVLRIEQEAVSVPRDFAYDGNAESIEYGFVNIDGRPYLLPVNSVNESCGTGTSNCTRNVIQFRNYRKFSADSNVTFQ
jgi:hypothetical protein